MLAVYADLAHLLQRAQVQIVAPITAVVANHELSYAQWCALLFIYRNPAGSAAQFCRHTGYDTGAATRLFDRLQARRLLNRRRSQNDRRIVALHVTKSGRELIDALLPTVTRTEMAIYKRVPASELRLLEALLARLINTVH